MNSLWLESIDKKRWKFHRCACPSSVFWDFNYLHSTITSIKFYRFHRIIGSDRKDFDVTVKPERSANENKEISSFRRCLPQVLACSAKNLLIVEFGLAISFSTILISALTGLNPKLNPNETLSITPQQSTWIASITMIFQPVGGFLTGFTEPLGRKRALILVNIPFAIAWITLYFAYDLFMIYSAFAWLGIGIGLLLFLIYLYIWMIGWNLEIRSVLTRLNAFISLYL